MQSEWPSRGVSANIVSKAKRKACSHQETCVNFPTACSSNWLNSMDLIVSYFQEQTLVNFGMIPYNYEKSHEENRRNLASMYSYSNFFGPYQAAGFMWEDDPVIAMFKKYPKMKRWYDLIEPKADVVYIQHNCNHWYSSVVLEIMKHVAVDSWGPCHRNRDFPPGFDGASSFSYEMYLTKLSIIRKYKYVIAFENFENPDWMTEKTWHPLFARVVPITSAINLGFNKSRPEYLNRRIPDETAVVWLGDFNNPEELGNYLTKGNSSKFTDPKVFEHHTQWHRMNRCDLPEGILFFLSPLPFYRF